MHNPKLHNINIAFWFVLKIVTINTRLILNGNNLNS